LLTVGNHCLFQFCLSPI